MGSAKKGSWQAHHALACQLTLARTPRFPPPCRSPTTASGKLGPAWQCMRVRTA